jgi:hypothetical protein
MEYKSEVERERESFVCVCGGGGIIAASNA